MCPFGAPMHSLLAAKSKKKTQKKSTKKTQKNVLKCLKYPLVSVVIVVFVFKNLQHSLITVTCFKKCSAQVSSCLRRASSASIVSIGKVPLVLVFEVVSISFRWLCCNLMKCPVLNTLLGVQYLLVRGIIL